MALNSRLEIFCASRAALVQEVLLRRGKDLLNRTDRKSGEPGQ